MIGNQKEARVLLDYVHRRTRRKPEGWKCLGRVGTTSSRAVYLSPSGVVYKVPSPKYGCDDWQQSAEVHGYSLRYRLPRGWRVPETRLMWVDGNPVIAQRFVEGKHPRNYRRHGEAEAAFDAIESPDDHNLNWKVDAKGTRWIIDLGSSGVS